VNKFLDWRVIWALGRRTLIQYFESLIAYGVAMFVYGLTGGIFAFSFFLNKTASIQGIRVIAPWSLWFFVAALTMGLISEEIKSGTFEQLSTLPLRDWEIVIGKYLGYAGLCLILVLGFLFYPILVSLLALPGQGFDWGETVGILSSLYLLSLAFGAMGMYASSLSRNQVVSFVIGVTLTSFFFFIGQFYTFFPGFLAQVADFLGILSHLQTLGRGVWDLRDLLYFLSMIIIFLYFTVQRLATRRF